MSACSAFSSNPRSFNVRPSFCNHGEQTLLAAVRAVIFHGWVRTRGRRTVSVGVQPLRGNVNVFVAEDAAWISAWKPGAGARTTDPLRRWYAGERRTPRGTRAPRWPRVALAQ